MLNGRRILIAPLDWGLGHAARCIPIINALKQHGAIPIIGTDGAPLALLREEFPELETVTIPGYPVKYSSSGDQLLTLMRQFPSMLGSIQQEKHVVDRLVQEMKLDAIISDQRFGIRNARIPSILITHQVFPRAPILASILQRINRMYISRFDLCWIMDDGAAPGAAGDLSHGPPLPENGRYIGVQSRFHKTDPQTARKKYRCVAVLSGPEPQRSILEKLLLGQFRTIDGEHLLVQGLMQNGKADAIGNTEIKPHATAQELQEILHGAELVIARSGYTTIMDLLSIGANALLIPTPGQPEQEYLADLHAGGGNFVIQQQHELDLAAALRSADRSPRGMPGYDRSRLEAALQEFAGMLR